MQAHHHHLLRPFGNVVRRHQPAGRARVLTAGIIRRSTLGLAGRPRAAAKSQTFVVVVSRRSLPVRRTSDSAAERLPVFLMSDDACIDIDLETERPLWVKLGRGLPSA